MTYTIAIIENVHTGRKAELWSSGKWRTVWIAEGGEHYCTAKLDRDHAEQVFYKLCKYVTEYLYSYAEIVEMLKVEEAR